MACGFSEKQKIKHLQEDNNQSMQCKMHRKQMIFFTTKQVVLTFYPFHDVRLT